MVESSGYLIHLRCQDVTIVTVFHLDKEEPVWHDTRRWVHEKRLSAIGALLRMQDLLHDEASGDWAKHVVSVKFDAVCLV